VYLDGETTLYTIHLITAIEEKIKRETPEVYNDMMQQQEKTALE